MFLFYFTILNSQLQSRSFERSSSRKREVPPQDEVLQFIKKGVENRSDVKLVRKITKTGRDRDTEEDLWGVCKLFFLPLLIIWEKTFALVLITPRGPMWNLTGCKHLFSKEKIHAKIQMDHFPRLCVCIRVEYFSSTRTHVLDYHCTICNCVYRW